MENVEELNKLCRVCLEDLSGLIGVEENVKIGDSTVKLCEAIEFCTQIEIDGEDQAIFPHGVCENCLNSILQAYKFKEFFISSCDKLRSLLQQDGQLVNAECGEIKIEPLLVDVKIEGGRDDINEKNNIYMVEEEDFDRFDDFERSNDDEDEEKSTSEEEEEVDREMLSKTIEYFKNNENIKNGVVTKHDKRKIGILLRHLPNPMKGKQNFSDRELIRYVNLIKNHKFPAPKRNPVRQTKTPPAKKPVPKIEKREAATSDDAGGNADDDVMNEASENDDDGSEKNEQKNLFPCEICNKYVTKMSMKAHLKIHDRDENFLCSECGQTFRQQQGLKSHMHLHHPKKMRKCTQCEKEYKTLNALRYHMAFGHNIEEENLPTDVEAEVTGKEKPILDKKGLLKFRKDVTSYRERVYPCNVCGKILRQPHGLKKHLLIHTGEKPYQCTICGKKIRYANALTLHMRFHTGEKPYSCSICDLKFTSSSSVQDHMTVHTEKIPRFSCEYCSKIFIRKRTLVEHLKVHKNQNDSTASQEQPVVIIPKVEESVKTLFECEQCPKIYRTRAAYNHHLEFGHIVKV